MHMQMTPVRVHAHTQSGFSLLEVLIALVIMSVTSLALFQSIRQLAMVSKISVNASEKSIKHFSDDALFAHLVEGLVPQWDNQLHGQFKGYEEGFLGLSVGQIFPSAQSLASMEMRLEHHTDTTKRLKIIESKNIYTLDRPLPGDAGVFYRGWDQVWYQNWPPETVPSTGFFEDYRFLEMPQLPSAIKIARAPNSGRVYFIANISEPYTPPFFNPIIGEGDLE